MIEFLFEILLQIILEIFASVLGHVLGAPFKSRPQPGWAIAGYALYGTAVGLFSVWLLPHSYLEWQWLRVANFLISPLLCGLVMYRIGEWRRKREKRVIGLDSFAYGACFAFFVTLVRFFFAA